jgi:hypothetical protein
MYGNSILSGRDSRVPSPTTTQLSPGGHQTYTVRQSVRERLPSLHAQDMGVDSQHCSFVLLAEFDIDRGAQLTYQFPQPLGADEGCVILLIMRQSITS